MFTDSVTRKINLKSKKLTFHPYLPVLAKKGRDLRKTAGSMAELQFRLFTWLILFSAALENWRSQDNTVGNNLGCKEPDTSYCLIVYYFIS